jgi:hypothetical protein
MPSERMPDEDLLHYATIEETNGKVGIIADLRALVVVSTRSLVMPCKDGLRVVRLGK